jgi:S-adenosylmethionine:tRNA ribosyltransferase-isomerase
VVELRRVTTSGTEPLLDAQPGDRLRLPAEATAVLIEPYVPLAAVGGRARGVRLWIADITTADGVAALAAGHGEPIRYGYVTERWPIAYYQTVFASEAGSAEMPSAGRPFTPAVIARLRRMGVRIAPILLHAGVSSMESDEPPQSERFRVPAATAHAVNAARRSGHRVIAVGTTSVRAIETVADPDGLVHPGEGWTDLVVTPARGVFGVDGVLTGFHAPRASHLSMLEALAGGSALSLAYAAALRNGYLWHEFGDLHLLLARDVPHVSQRGAHGSDRGERNVRCDEWTQPAVDPPATRPAG